MFFWDFGFGLYNALLTIYIRSLGASDVQIGLLVGIQGVARLAITLPSGAIVDRVSRRKLIIWTSLLTVPAVVIYGLAQTWWQILPGMVLIMAGNAGTPALSSYIAEVVKGPDRTRAFAMIYTVGPAIALIVAPTLGGIIGEAISLRAIFFFSAASFLVSSGIMSRIAERPLTAHGSEAPSYREVIRLPAVRWIGLLQMGALATCAIGATFLSNYLQDVHRLDLGTIGRFYSVSAIGSVVLSIVIGRIAWLSGCRGIALGVVAVGCVCGVTLLTGNPWILAVAFLGRGGYMVAWSLFPAVLGDVTPGRLRSRAFAFSDFLGGIGLALAPFAAGAMYDVRPALPLLATLIAAPCMGLAALIIERRFVAPTAKQRTLESDLATTMEDSLAEMAV